MNAAKVKTLVTTSSVLLTAAVVSAGCAQEAPSTPASDSVANVVQSHEEAQSEEEPEGPSVADLEAYFEALASNDPVTMEEAVELAAPGSNAQAYAIYLQALAQADRDAGHSLDAEVVERTDEGFSICEEGAASAEQCTEFTNIQHEGDKIADLEPGGEALKGRLTLGSGEHEPLGDLGTVSMIAAFESASGNLLVVLEVKSSSPGMWAVAQYVGPDGRQTEMTEMSGPTGLAEGALANYAFFFEGAEIGGELQVEGIDEDGYHVGAAAFPTE